MRGACARQGLPTDDLSVQNGILVTRATRFPILVDPQGQGRAWLRQREAAAQLRTIGLADRNFRAALEVHLGHACSAVYMRSLVLCSSREFPVLVFVS